MSITLPQLLKAMTERAASDLHITTGSPPQLRIDGRLVAVKSPPLTPSDTKQLCYSILTESQKAKFEAEQELDLSFGVKGLSRYRANIFVQRGAVAGVFRTIPFKIQPLADLMIPQIVGDLALKPRGLILVTGPTGSGKSTTLASMIDLINTERNHHIITIEDPIEFLHPHKNSLINQREVGTDTKSFTSSLKYVLRQDPDVVLIGEIRDLETMEATLRIAETGHLVFATLHTNNTIQTIHRIIDMFPPHQQTQIRAQLSFVLAGILAQMLVPKASGIGRVVAIEILIPNAAIRALIRDDKLHQIYGTMQTGQSKHGMQTFNQSLLGLYRSRMITFEEALSRSHEPEEFMEMVKDGEKRDKMSGGMKKGPNDSGSGGFGMTNFGLPNNSGS